MKILTKPGAIIKIQLLQGSQAKNYLESKERLFLNTILSKLQQDYSTKLPLSSNEKSMLVSIFEKYKKFL